MVRERDAAPEVPSGAPGSLRDVWAELPDRVRVLRSDEGRQRARVAERVWMTGGPFLPELMVQRLHAEPRESGTPADHHADVRGCTEETRAWALEQASWAGLAPQVWRLTIELVERWAVDPTELAGMPHAPNARPEPNPVFEALSVVADEQRFHNRADVNRARAAVAAWRAALVEEDAPGAANTPYQKGFFLDLGLALGVAAGTAQTLVHTAHRIERDLPLVWGRFLAATVPWRAMQAVHAAIDGLAADVLPRFDEAAVVVLDETPVPLLPDALRRLAERLQASTADDRRARAMTRRRVTIEPAPDGMGWLHAYLPAEDLLAIDHQLTKAAIAEHGRSPESGGITTLRADVLRDGLIAALAEDADPIRSGTLVPHRRGVQARVAVLIPAMTALGHSTVPAKLQGYGPIGMKTALRLAGEATSWVRVLTDPFTGAVLNIGRKKYRPTSDMRTLLRLLDGGARDPGSTRAPEQTEVDHNRSFWLHDEQGETAIDNLVLLSRLGHGVKTADEADVGLLKDRTLLWGTRAGNRYVTRPHDPPEPTPIPPDLVDPDDCPF